MIVSFQCFYCGNEWQREYYSLTSFNDVECPSCKSKEIKKFKNIDTKDVFGYNTDRKDKK